MKKVIIIGGGPAGLAAAGSLRGRAKVTIVERDEALGGKLRDWHRLFPTSTPASEVLDELMRGIEGVDVRLGSEVAQVGSQSVRLADGENLMADAVIAASGFEIFNALMKEEYGYGVYDHVYTTADVERMLSEGVVPITPRRIAFVHCVGSRDEKVGQRHCSKVCCVTAVKQAMEMREIFPEAEIFNFYMDIRMFGPGYEELYQQAQQEARVNFIRGRVSEASPTFDGRIQIKAEDTLVGRPMKMTVDMLVLVVGMRGNPVEGLTCAPNGFVIPRDMFGGCVDAFGGANIFAAGTATAPKTVGESIAEGVMAAQRVLEAL